MYPDQFDYHRADSVGEALDLLEDHPDAELISGGHSLLPMMKSGLASPDVLVDIGSIDALTGIEANGDATHVGANVTYAAVDDSEHLWDRATQFAEAAHHVGDIQVRNRGTIGGNVAHADPAGDPPAAVLASNATIHATGPNGDRAIDADDYFQGMYMTALAEDEILTGVEVPHLREGDAGAYVKKPSPSSGYAMVGVAVRLRTDGDRIEDARVACNGALDHATRLRPVEDHLEDDALDDEALAGDAAAHATDDVEDFELMDDLQASGEFRAQLLTVYTERAIETAIDRVSS